jgi:hypothetical protein
VVQILERLKEMDYWVAALAPEGEVGLYELDVSRRLAIVVGAEGEGLRRLVKERADFLVKIPMAGRVASTRRSRRGSCCSRSAATAPPSERASHESFCGEIWVVSHRRC